MAFSRLVFLALAATLSFSSAASIRARQEGPVSIDRYITQVESALLAIDSIRNGCIGECCRDPNYAASLNEQGNDGERVQLLLSVSLIP